MNVAEELTAPAEELNVEHVERRVRDWNERIGKLYRSIQTWLPDNILGSTDSYVSMHEDLMRQFGVMPTSLPILTLMRDGAWLAKLVPQALWIIGANGRVDLLTSKGQWLLVDRSENFSPPNWLIAPSLNRRDIATLDAKSLLRAVGK